MSDFLYALPMALAFKEHWGCESCDQHSGLGHPTLPQSLEEEEVRKKTERNAEEADECETGQNTTKKKRGREI